MLITFLTCFSLQVIFSQPGNPLPLKLLSYYIVLFPSIDAISSYPLMNHVISNNLYSLITGQDSSKEPKYRFDKLLKVSLRSTATLLPILAAFGVANLIYIFKYAGLVGFLNLFFPTLLQLRSIYVCKNKFSKPADSEVVDGVPATADVEHLDSDNSLGKHYTGGSGLKELQELEDAGKKGGSKTAVSSVCTCQNHSRRTSSDSGSERCSDVEAELLLEKENVERKRIFVEDRSCCRCYSNSLASDCDSERCSDVEAELGRSLLEEDNVGRKRRFVKDKSCCRCSRSVANDCDSSAELGHSLLEKDKEAENDAVFLSSAEPSRVCLCDGGSSGNSLALGLG